MTHRGWRPPVATAAVLVVTSVVSVLGFLYPGVLEALRRDPRALAEGEWWRMATPLLVHDGGWLHLVLNAVGLIVIGTAAERLFGLGGWLALYLAGEVAGYAWQPDGAGNSVAIFGLAGGLVAVLFTGRKVPLIASLFVVYWVSALNGGPSAVSGRVSYSACLSGARSDCCSLGMLEREGSPFTRES